VYYCTTRFYNKKLTFTSFYFKSYVILHWYVISTSKIIIIVFFLFSKLIQVMLEAFYRFNITGEWILVMNCWIQVYENYRRFIEAITCLPQNWHLLWWAKMKGTLKRALVSPWRMLCMYSGMAKGTSRAEAMLNSENIKSVVLAIVELRESEGISQSVS